MGGAAVGVGLVGVVVVVGVGVVGVATPGQAAPEGAQLCDLGGSSAAAQSAVT